MAAFTKYRFEVRRIAADPGSVERNMSDCPAVRDAQSLKDVLEGLASGQLDFHEAAPGYLYPNCLYFTGHLHIIFNALKSAVERLPVWGQHVDLLRGLNTFLKELGLRQRFQEVCMKSASPAELALLDCYKTANIDWKWEWLSSFLGQLRVIYPVLRKCWSLEAMGATASRGAFLTAATFKLVDQAVHTQGFTCRNLVLLSCARSVERVAHKLEGCPCHEEIWAQRSDHSSRIAAFRHATGFDNCPWKGCWGSHMALGMASDLIDGIMAASNPELVRLLDSEPADVRFEVLDMGQMLKAALAEELNFKWSFWQQIPHKILGAFGCQWGFEQHAVQTCIHECFRQYGAALEAGKKKRVHRVAIRLLDPQGQFRPALAMLANGSLLASMLELHRELTAMCLSSLVERNTEGEHAKIKQEALGKAGSITPGTIAALLRAPEMHRLLQDPMFVAWASSVWHGPLMVKSVLSFFVPVRQLLAKSISHVYGMVYLFDRHVQHRDARLDGQAMLAWSGAVADQACHAVHALSWQEKLLVDYIKSRCDNAGHIALPSEFVERATKDTHTHTHNTCSSSRQQGFKAARINHETHELFHMSPMPP